MSNTEKIEKIIGQYQNTVGALDIMFSVARSRTKWEIWRFNGVGSCKYVDKSYSETGIIGDAQKDIIDLREQRNRDFGGASTISPCPYHRAEHGCVLGSLKSPLCISHFDAAWEWKKSFDVDASTLKPEIEATLVNILNGRALEDPTVVDIFNEKVISITECITQYSPLE